MGDEIPFTPGTAAAPVEQRAHPRRVLFAVVMAIAAILGVAAWSATNHSSDSSNTRLTSASQTLTAKEKAAEWREDCLDRHWTLVSDALAAGDLRQLYYEYGTQSPLTQPLLRSATNFQRNVIQYGRKSAAAQLEEDLNGVCDLLEAPPDSDY